MLLRHKAFLSLLTVAAALLLSAQLESAGAQIPPPAPLGPTVFMFRGGNAVFGGIGWGGGPTVFDRQCEGIIRQVVGGAGPGELVNSNGKPLVVPVDQRITVGGNVVGFKSAIGTQRAYNIDAPGSSWAIAFAALGTLGENDSLYSCGHGGPSSITLDGGVFDGFRSAVFPAGTGRGAGPAYRALAAPARAVQAYLHHCNSSTDPDENIATAPHAVSHTLAQIPRVSIAHGHNRTAAANRTRVNVKGGTDPQMRAALQALGRAARAAGFVDPDPDFPNDRTKDRAGVGRWLDSFNQLSERYAEGQAIIDREPGLQNVVTLVLKYEDFGDHAKPAGAGAGAAAGSEELLLDLEEVVTGCEPGAPVGGVSLDPAAGPSPTDASGTSSSSDAWLLEAIAASAAGAVVLGGSVWYARRRRRSAR